MKNLTPNQKRLLQLCGFLIGVLVGAMMVFNVFFLSKVIPHGGI